jgi:oligoendopeptidase F
MTYRPTAGQLPERGAIPASYTWDLSHICPSWDEWQAGYRDLDSEIEAFKSRQGTLASGPDALTDAFRAMDRMGVLSYRVWYYASLRYDEDQRNNDINARRQRVQILFAREHQASSWFNPELLAIPLDTIRQWMEGSPDLALYRFAIEALFHEQEHVLDEQGERLLAYASRSSSVSHDSYAALTTADMKPPTITLAAGDSVALSYGQYRAILETNRNQDDRATAYRAFHQVYADNRNTYAALYNGVLQRDWFHARARGYATTLEAALHGNNIPSSVVETLIGVTREGVEPLRRYHRLRREALGLARYRLHDLSIPLVEHDARYKYDEVTPWIVDSVAALGDEYQQHVREAFSSRWIDVFENAGKRSGAYSAPVYGNAPVHAVEFQRDTRCGVHARPRDGSLDAYAPGASGAALRLRGLYDLRRRGPVDAERSAVPRLHASAGRQPRPAGRPPATCHRQHREHVLHAGDVCRLRAAGASARRAGSTDHGGGVERHLRAASA